MPSNVGKVKYEVAVGIAGRGGGGRIARAGASVDEVFAQWILSPPARIPPVSQRTGVQAVLFDLDGVLVDTATFHYRAWKRLAEELGLEFDERANMAFRGVGRMECLDKLLGPHGKGMAAEEKHVLADRKNGYYLEQVKRLRPGDLAPGAAELMKGLRAADVRTALVSASKNARLVVRLLAIEEWFGVIVDGADVVKGKPEPDCFLLAARKLRVDAEHCVVIEDADAGVRAGHAAGMACIGIGPTTREADVSVPGVGMLSAEMIEEAWCGAGVT